MAELRLPDDNVIPFTDEELDSLLHLRDLEYDPHRRERKLMDAIGLLAMSVQPLRAVGRVITRPVTAGTNRLVSWLDGRNLIPVTRRQVIRGGAMTSSPQEAGELAQMMTKPGESVMRVGTKYDKFGPQPFYEYRSPLSTKAGPATLREVRPGPKKYKMPSGDYSVTIDRGIDKPAPDFSGLPKRGPKVSGPASSEIIY
jgi:hypothetical protein